MTRCRVVLCANQQATCSRVGVPNMAAELAVSSSHNVQHIADTWLSHRKRLVYRINRLHIDETDPADSSDTDAGDSSRSTMIPQQTRCRHFDWYLSNVAAATGMFTPSTNDPLQFGILRVSTKLY